tara:strand:- start:2051 stop:2983 length:933 start_codon:yes stop_codon:yes gene_type:complete
MQEDKLKNLSQAEALVPLDTDGEEVEIELEGVASETEATAEVEEAVEKTNNEELKAEDTEHEEYSKGVQKRIDKLTAKLREAERREKAATDFASNVQKENETLKTKTKELDENYVLAEANRITAETEKAKNDLRAANETDDIDKQTDAQQRLAVLAGEAQRMSALNKEREKVVETPPSEQQPAQTAPQAAPEQYPDPDPKAQDWADKNEWFGQDRAMTMTSFAIHEDLIKEGFDPKSDEYYTEVDTRIRSEFPHKFDEDTSTKNRPVQTVASAKRSAKTGRSKSVKLTPSQVAIAKKLGVPLEEYAKYVK